MANLEYIRVNFAMLWLECGYKLEMTEMNFTFSPTFSIVMLTLPDSHEQPCTSTWGFINLVMSQWYHIQLP